MALSDSKALISPSWTREINIFDLSGEKLRTLSVPPTDGREHPLAIKGNLAIVGVPGLRYEPKRPGEAFLFDVDTGEVLVNFSAGNRGVVSRHGGDGFGASVAIQGQFALIGAPYDSELADRSGAAYLFNIRTGELVEKILPHFREYPLMFGRNVALTGAHVVIEDLTYAGPEQVPMTTVYAIPEPRTVILTTIALSAMASATRRRRAL
jgi:hypothetical protein